MEDGNITNKKKGIWHRMSLRSKVEAYVILGYMLLFVSFIALKGGFAG